MTHECAILRVFEDEIDTEDEAAAAIQADIAVPKHLQPDANGGDHSQCGAGASCHCQAGDGHKYEE